MPNDNVTPDHLLLPTVSFNRALTHSKDRSTLDQYIYKDERAPYHPHLHPANFPGIRIKENSQVNFIASETTVTLYKDT